MDDYSRRDVETLLRNALQQHLGCVPVSRGRALSLVMSLQRALICCSLVDGVGWGT